MISPAFGQDADRQAAIDQILSDNPDVRYVSEADKFYKPFWNQVLWNEAEAMARDVNVCNLEGVPGQLATIRSQAEQDVIDQIVNNQQRAWLGGRDINENGVWYWLVDGVPEAVPFYGGDTSPPTSGGGGEAEVSGQIRASGGGSSVDHWNITHSGGSLDINVTTSWGDPELELFIDNGNGSYTFVQQQDGGLNVSNLDAGNYMVAIGDDSLSTAEALNTSDPYPNGNTSSGTYTMTLVGNAVVTGFTENPDAPGTKWGDPGNDAVGPENGTGGGGTGGGPAYTNFLSGEPNNWQGRGEYFLETDTSGLWNDNWHESGRTRAFIVEWSAEEVLGPGLEGAPSALDSIPVPEPSNLSKFIKSKEKAIALGKALFWDMQVGSDGRSACATCHFGAGIDLRTVNVVNPGAPGSAFGPQRDGQQALLDAAIAAFEGANEPFEADEFPHTKTAHPTNSIKSSSGSNNQVVEDTPEVYGSQGVVKRDFVRIIEGNPVDEGNLVFDPIFNIGGANARQVTARNTPTTINAVFFDRLFWDGRANNVFNGVNAFGRTDGSARVYKRNNDGTLKRVRIALENSALASQAVDPPISDVEMSWHGRNFKELGRKMLSLRPLALQKVDPQDSVLGRYATSRRGLRIKYASLVKQAFKKNWWGGVETTSDGYTHMEANFSLYFGLALQSYQSTLVSDETPYDDWANGDENALTDAQKRGLKIFLNEGKCINCHGGPEFAGATISDIRDDSFDPETGDSSFSLVEFMDMQQGPTAFYDGGFYNIGVRPTLEDLGVGARGPFGPLSYTRQRRDENRDIGQDVTVNNGDRVAVDGAFKTPTLRNIELTGPFFHNGGARTLREVVEFYTRGANFFHENIDDLDPDVDGISELQDDPSKIDDVVAFMKSLTDERVRFQRAPFDHPELRVVNGHKDEAANGVAVDRLMTIPAVGKNGGDEIKAFDKRVQ